MVICNNIIVISCDHHTILSNRNRKCNWATVIAQVIGHLLYCALKGQAIGIIFYFSW